MRLLSTTLIMILVSIFVVTSPSTLTAADMGSSGGHDLDELWSRAQETFDLTVQDAVVLLESRGVTMENGVVRTRIHRVVWIGTARGIRGYADLRIPFNTATSTLTVVSLRTWREDRWWPHESEISPTAVVETLPYAVATADDYTTMRETMLLHDGVELPCIMETMYEIETTTPVDGADGHWVFPQRDPALIVEFNVTTPDDKTLLFTAENGASEPEIARVNGTATHAWRMENVEPLGFPVVSTPAAYAPYITWSTWEDWNALGRTAASGFDAAAVLDDTLADTLDSYIENTHTSAAKARAVASFVNECSRSIHYSSRHWMFTPRSATRTWDTAYGHGLDRAVLATALFRRAGLQARPVYRSHTTLGINIEIPGLARLEEVGVHVNGEGFNAFYDPSAGTLIDGPIAFDGRIVWSPGTGEAPLVHTVLGDSDRSSRFGLFLTLEPGDDGGWKGAGVLDADGLFCPYGDMTGLGGESLAFLERIAGSVLPGSKVTAFNPDIFESERVVVGFDFEMPAPATDDLDRTGVVLGNPAGGIAARLPSDVHLYNEHRGSPVVLPGKMTQQIKLRIKTGKQEIVHIPESFEIDNTIGHYSVRSINKAGWVTIDRELSVFVAVVEAGLWPDLRALLLEDENTGGKMILLK